MTGDTTSTSVVPLFSKSLEHGSDYLRVTCTTPAALCAHPSWYQLVVVVI